MATGDTFRGRFGQEYIVVWCGQRDDASLLPDYPRQSTLGEVTRDARKKLGNGRQQRTLDRAKRECAS